MRVVIDTNVLVSALRYRRGASFRFVQKLGSPQFQPVISPPLCLEYEDVFRRPGLLPGYTAQDSGDFLDLLSGRVHRVPDSFPLAGSAPFIITHNTRDFQGVDALGIRAVTPDDFLSILSAA